MKPEILKALELYAEADDLCIDWLLKSNGLRGEDFDISRLYYKKACKNRAKLANKLKELCQK